jgi:predicted dehydrogenase
MTQLIHELDLMCHLFGAVAEVGAVVGTRSAPIESEDTCAATVRFASGAIAVCYATMCAHRSSHGFDVIGDAGSAHSPWAYESLDADRRDAGRADAVLVAPDIGPDPESGAHTPYLEAVLDALDVGAPLPVGPEEGRAAVELCAAIYASALSGAPIALPMGAGDRFYDGVSAGDYASIA